MPAFRDRSPARSTRPTCRPSTRPTTASATRRRSASNIPGSWRSISRSTCSPSSTTSSPTAASCLAFLRTFTRLGPINRSVQALLSAFFHWKKANGLLGSSHPIYMDFMEITTLAKAERPSTRSASASTKPSG